MTWGSRGKYNESTIQIWLRTHTTRVGTLIVGWGVLGAAFVYRLTC